MDVNATVNLLRQLREQFHNKREHYKELLATSYALDQTRDIMVGHCEAYREIIDDLSKSIKRVEGLEFQEDEDD